VVLLPAGALRPGGVDVSSPAASYLEQRGVPTFLPTVARALDPNFPKGLWRTGPGGSSLKSPPGPQLQTKAPASNAGLILGYWARLCMDRLICDEQLHDLTISIGGSHGVQLSSTGGEPDFRDCCGSDT
jgi:hypothetical protein